MFQNQLAIFRQCLWHKCLEFFNYLGECGSLVWDNVPALGHEVVESRWTQPRLFQASTFHNLCVESMAVVIIWKYVILMSSLMILPCGIFSI